MRIYGLEESLDKFVKDDNFQIEIIGEGGCWTVEIRRRKWSNLLQRYTYEDCAGGTAPDFLAIYDMIANAISAHQWQE